MEFEGSLAVDRRPLQDLSAFRRLLGPLVDDVEDIRVEVVEGALRLLAVFSP